MVMNIGDTDSVNEVANTVAEIVRKLFETKRNDKDGDVFVTYEGECYPW